MDIDPHLAIAVLQAHPDSLGTTPQVRDAYIQEARARLGGRNSDDRREATKLAVETAKMFLTISVGLLVASFAWMQYAHQGGVIWLSPPMVPFYLAALLLVWSMSSGFLAISDIYKRADGREAPSQPAWATQPVAGRLNVQSWTGAAALIALFAGVISLSLQGDAIKPAVSIVIPGKMGSPAASGSITLEGDWTELHIKTAAQQEIKLPKQTLPVTIACQ